MERDRILVVDDEVRWLETVNLMLADRYDVATARTPGEALDLVAARSFALAILDQRIAPTTSGVELLGELQARQPGLPGIILTGFADVDDAVESLHTGAVDYISKGKRDLADELRGRVARALAPAIQALLRKGEGRTLEFKSSARWDQRLKRVNHDLEATIVKTVSAFLNSESGGILLIGVDDSGRPIGLQSDYATLKRPDRDGFEAFLTGLFVVCGGDLVSQLRIDFQAIDGNDVCRVSVSPASRAVFVPDGSGGEHFYLRVGNTSRRLSTREAIEYCKVRWR